MNETAGKLSRTAKPGEWSRAFRDSGLQTTTIAVGLIMATHADYETGGNIWASAETIARESGFKPGPHARKTVYNHQAALVAAGWLKQTYSAKRGQHSGETNRWCLAIPCIPGKRHKEPSCVGSERPLVSLESDTTIPLETIAQGMHACQPGETDEPPTPDPQDYTLRDGLEDANFTAECIAEVAPDCAPLDIGMFGKFLLGLGDQREIGMNAIVWWIKVKLPASKYTRSPGAVLCAKLLTEIIPEYQAVHQADMEAQHAAEDQRAEYEKVAGLFLAAHPGWETLPNEDGESGIWAFRAPGGGQGGYVQWDVVWNNYLDAGDSWNASEVPIKQATRKPA